MEHEKGITLEGKPDDALMSFEEVRSYLKLGASTLRHHIAVGNLRSQRVGRLVRVRVGDLRAWLGRA